MHSEVEKTADFSRIRYAQCWEDADVVLAGMNIKAGQTCLSIASAGDNTLAILSKAPGKVLALDLSAAQLACLELRVAAYKELTHAQLLVLMGVRDGGDRRRLYERCEKHLSPGARAFWRAHQAAIEIGIGCAGKFENYFRLFRRYILPMVHTQATIDGLLEARSPSQREQYFEQRWNTWNWRMLFKLFFSRATMGMLGRDPSFFRYVTDSVSTFLLKSTTYALTRLDPSSNPYLQWVLLGTYKSALPFSLRPENFEAIKANIDRLEWHQKSLEDFLEDYDGEPIDSFNLSNVFEYMAEPAYHALLKQIARRSAPNARLVYWNMLADRKRPQSMAAMLRSLPDLSQELYAENKAFFYSRLVVEEAIK